jgi:hypothetical protein
MLTTAFFGSWLAYLAITFALGFLWHLVVFKDLYRRLAIYSRIDDPIVPLGFLSMLIQGAVLALPLPAGYRGNESGQRWAQVWAAHGALPRQQRGDRGGGQAARHLAANLVRRGEPVLCCPVFTLRAGDWVDLQRVLARAAA